MNKYNWHDKDLIISDLKQCVSIADFLKKQQMSLTSGNYGSFKKWTQYHNIKTKDFFKEKNNFYKLDSINKTIVSLDDLCIDSKINKKQLIGLIKKHNLLTYQCKCGNKGIWNNNPLTLQLEHKNGNNTDNRIENLEYLCPNCHAQTKTYGSKNKHNKIYDKRINDIKKMSKENNSQYDLLANLWKCKSISVYGWILEHKEKLKLSGICFEKIDKWIKPNENKKNPVSFNQEKLEELSKYEKLTEENKKQLAEKWNVSLYKLEYWIKNNMLDLYINSYKCSKNHLIKINKNKLREKVDIIIKNDVLQNKEKNVLLLDLFCKNKASLEAYIKKYNIIF